MERAIITRGNSYASIITDELELRERIIGVSPGERLYFVSNANNSMQTLYVEVTKATVEDETVKLMMSFYRDYSRFVDEVSHVPMDDYLIKTMTSNGFPEDLIPDLSINEVPKGSLTTEFANYVLNYIDATQAMAKMPY